jgi:hypothetical protein
MLYIIYIAYDIMCYNWDDILSTGQHCSYFAEVVHIECFVLMCGTEHTLSVHFTRFLVGLCLLLGYCYTKYCLSTIVLQFMHMHR